MADLFNPFAFAVGMLALVNPCGFALLPAYLGFFLGQQDETSGGRVAALNRAQLVGLSMSAGFLAVFTMLGVVLAGFYQSLQEWLPYFSITMGVLLVVLGLAMIRGFQPTLRIPKLDKGTGSRGIGSMFVFGVSYAIASLSCTIGLFITAVGTSSNATSYVERLGGFLSYGAGMGLLATALTLAVAFGKQGIVNSVRSLLPKINMISGFVLLLVGPYVALYGIWELQVFDLNTEPTPWIDSIITTGLGWQEGLASWIDARSTVLGWSFFLLNAGLIVAGAIARATRPAPTS